MNCKTNANLSKINYFVFFDMETTGLIQKEKNIMPKITELALLAVSRNAIESDEGMPRVRQKLVILCNPETEIPPIVYDMTGLNNGLLQNEQRFSKNTLDTIKMFVNGLQAPICFVAHRGNSFDYPILLHMCNLIEMDFPPEILCIDSWEYFRSYFGKLTNSTRPTLNIPNHSSPLQKTPSSTCLNSSIIQNNSFNNSSDDSLKRHSSSMSFPDDDWDDTNAIDSPKLPKTCSETLESSMQILNEETPVKTLEPLKIQHSAFPVSPENFKLETLYTFFGNQVMEKLHEAENDCLALLHCCYQTKENFIEFAEKHAKPLVKFKLKVSRV